MDVSIGVKVMVGVTHRVHAIIRCACLAVLGGVSMQLGEVVGRGCWWLWYPWTEVRS